MSAPRLVSVAPALKGTRAPTIERALELHPNSENARRWLLAVAYLRTRSVRGWILDSRSYPTLEKHK